jgi:hypothetical protein
MVFLVLAAHSVAPVPNVIGPVSPPVPGSSYDLRLASVILEKFQNAFMQIAPGQWLVSAKATTAQQISDQLGITDGTNGSGIVFAISGYYGRAPNNIWEWIAANWQ